MYLDLHVNYPLILSDFKQTWIFLTEEKKETMDDTGKDVYSLLAQHVLGIIMPIVRRQTE